MAFLPSSEAESSPTYSPSLQDKTISLAEKVSGCPHTGGAAAYLMNYESGMELYAENADTPLPMASTTKLMTAIIVSETLDFEKTVTVKKESVGIEGSSIYLFEGEKISVKTLMYALLLESANDAATALAIECAGSVESFALLMNKKARDMGLKSTHFTNPHGLDDEEHYTTARELALIAAEALRDERIAQIVATKSYRAKVEKGEESYRHMTNHNRLLYTYDGAIGMKTGFTKRTGRCLVSAAKRDGMTLIAVTLNTAGDWQVHRNMLDFGFENYKIINIAEKNEITYKIECTGGTSGEITVTNLRTFSVFVNRDFQKEQIRLESKVIRPLFAPIKENTAIGTVSVYLGDETLWDIPLVSMDDVPKKETKQGIISKIKDYFSRE